VLGVAEEAGAFLGVVAELVAEDAKRPGGIGEPAGHGGGRLLVHKEGAEGFVLAVERVVGREEEGRGVSVC
jgi:hypothetical protein